MKKLYLDLDSNNMILSISEFGGEPLVETKYDFDEVVLHCYKNNIDLGDGYHKFINNEIIKINTMSDQVRRRIEDTLRQQRETECFPVINRGALWYETLTDTQKNELRVWYRAWLDVTETLEAPKKPDWL